VPFTVLKFIPFDKFFPKLHYKETEYFKFIKIAHSSVI